jgi:phosphoglycolate phosphatase-like HAD superfamily hydrolase
MKLVLFDLDGTLMLTGGAGLRAMERAGHLVFDRPFSLDGIMIGGSMDPLLYVEATTRLRIADAQTLHERFRDQYLLELERELTDSAANVRVMPGFPDLLHELREQPDIAVGMVTGNYAAAVPIKLSAIGFEVDWFEHNAFGDEGPDRPALVKLAIDRFTGTTGLSIDAADVVVVGDTPRDVHCAKANGCGCLAVGTGRYPLDELLEAGADVAVADLADPRPLHAMLQ